jgi:4-amino-4-deoxy-L-arabinose transferase-like glycosyltransferase
MLAARAPLGHRDYLLLALYCLVLYGVIIAFSGPLTLHEGVLAQTTRVMVADRDWIVPKYGTAPWLERPPLPQWITVGLTWAAGRGDEEWVVRLGPLLAGTLTVLLTAWLAGAWYGRYAGLLSGLILATMYEFTRYATLAEADIFLAPLVVGALGLFAHLECVWPQSAEADVRFLGRRPWPVLAFFVLVGLTNLVKGLVFGTAMVLIPVIGFLVWNGSLRAIRRYIWLWGWLAATAVAAAWPLAVMHRYPDAYEVWYFDLFGRLQQHYLEEPVWYYFGCLVWVLGPWTLCAFLGLGLAAWPAWRQRVPAARLLWCWALLPPLAFSLPQGKHHHYMIHYLAPWAILSAQALMWLWNKAQAWPGWLRTPLAPALLFGGAGDLALEIAAPELPGPGWLLPALLVAWPVLVLLGWWVGFHRNARLAGCGGFALVLLLITGGFAYKGQYLNRSYEDTVFLHEVRELVGPSEPLFLDPNYEPLSGLRTLFYFDDRLKLLHNLTFLKDERITNREVYVLARYCERAGLEWYGTPTLLLQSAHTRRETSPEERWSLFRLRLRDDLVRRPAAVRISPQQAMYRVPGPDLN